MSRSAEVPAGKAATDPRPASSVEAILDLARWAPSGDNSQPWRFEVLAGDHVRVHAFDTRRHCVYDLEGRASQLAVGAMLETMRIAASIHGLATRAALRSDSSPEAPLVDVRFEASPGLGVDPLHAAIRERSVQRKSLSTLPLGAATRAALESAVGPGYSVVWFEGWRARLRLAWLAVRSAKIRLTIPEAYAVHREIIDWDARFSDDKVPDQALGADPLTLRSMKWALASWERVQLMNRWFGGTLGPRLQLDFIPGLRCAAHFAIVAERIPGDVGDHLAAGAAVQRFWLTATLQKLQLQPQYTPLVFAGYARVRLPFTSIEGARRRAAAIAGMLDRLFGAQAAPRVVFLGRLGSGPPARARSMRLPLEGLMWAAARPTGSGLASTVGCGTSAERPGGAVPDRRD